MAKKPAPDSTRRSERSRRAIYDAALALVGEVGYPKTTHRGHRRPGRRGQADDLPVVVVQGGRPAGGVPRPERSRRRGRRARSPYVIPDTGDLAADLKAVLRLTVDQLKDPRFEVPSRALAAEGLVNEQLGRDFVAKLLEPSLQLYVARLRSAQRVRRGPPGDRPAHRPGTLRLAPGPALAPAHGPDLVRLHGHPRRLRPPRTCPTYPGCPFSAPRSTGWWDHRACCSARQQGEGDR